MLAELQRFYKEFGRVPRERDFRPKPEGYLFGSNTYKNVFGNWNSALTEAGLPIVKFGNNKGTKHSNDVLLSELRRYADETGTIPTSTMFDGLKYPHYCHYVSVFGSWHAALDAIGCSKQQTPAKHCPICGKDALKQRKTCGGMACIVALRNNSKPTLGAKVICYFNRYQNKVIKLQSTWELEIASLLDTMGIKWIRPKPIEWHDNRAIKHLYFPDFYLPDFDLYLDPKNHLVMQQDHEKMEYIRTKVKIAYGDLSIIKEAISKVVAHQ
jgi:predicted nucleic acid-binding Zn ribbon protein